MPFTTNGEFVKFCKSYDHVLAALVKAADKYIKRVSYAIVQPCMLNRKEYRVVVLDGAAKYVANISKNPHEAWSFSSWPHKSLFAFAENAVNALKMACPVSLTQGILRVDIFQAADGRLVVNEFESLEACIYSTCAKQEAAALTWMVDYWRRELLNSIQLAQSSRK